MDNDGIECTTCSEAHIKFRTEVKSALHCFYCNACSLRNIDFEHELAFDTVYNLALGVERAYIADEISEINSLGSFTWACSDCHDKCKKLFEPKTQTEDVPVEPSADVPKWFRSFSADISNQLLSLQSEVKSIKDSHQNHGFSASPPRKGMRSDANTFAATLKDNLNSFPSNIAASGSGLGTPDPALSANTFAPDVKINVKKNVASSKANILRDLHMNRGSLPQFSGRKKFDGSVDVLVKNYEDASVVREMLEKKMNGVEISPAIPNRMKYCSLVGLGFEMSCKEATDALIEENRHWLKMVKLSDNRIGLDGDPLALIEIMDVRHCKNIDFKVNVKISPNMLASLGKRKLSIGHSLCRLYRFKHHRRCFQCQEVGHISTDCVKPIACSRCSLEHSSQDCKSISFKCVNCSINNKDDTNHPSYSPICPFNNRVKY